MKDTISSLEADESPRVKALVEELQPWPLSNEEAWAIVKRHFADLELGYRIYKREAHDHEAKLHKIRKYIGRLHHASLIKAEIEAILDADEKGVEPCGSEQAPQPQPQSE